MSDTEEFTILPEEIGRLLAEGLDVVIKANGRSMLPFIRGGKDSVLLRKRDSIDPGDIVLAKTSDGDYVLHRVFTIDGDNITLMGDGNLQGKEFCSRGDILGTVEEIISPSGRHAKPSSGSLWKRLLPIRRGLLAIYRKVAL